MRTFWIIWHWEIGRRRWMLWRIVRSVRAARHAIHPDFSEMAAAGHMRPMPLKVPRGFRLTVWGEAYHPYGSRHAWTINTDGSIVAPPRFT